LQPDRFVAVSLVRIARIAFLVRAPGLFLDLGDDATYSGFTGSTHAAGDDVVSVMVASGDPAPPASARRIFDAAGAWSAYLLQDGDRAIAITPPGGSILMSARFDAALTRVSVTCGPRLLAEGRLLDPIRYPLDQLLLMYRLAAEGGAVIHCAVVALGDRTVICPGVSGAGKTTLARQLQGHDGLRVLSDDRAVVRRGVDGYVAWGTPWPGEGGWAQNDGRPLAAIGFLEKGPAASINRLSAREALVRMARVASVPWYDREVGPRAFDGLAALCARVPACTFTFAPDASAASAVHALAAAQARVPNSGSAT
jgi:hypothetical protein